MDFMPSHVEQQQNTLHATLDKLLIENNDYCIVIIIAQKMNKLNFGSPAG